MRTLGLALVAIAAGAAIATFGCTHTITTIEETSSDGGTASRTPRSPSSDGGASTDSTSGGSSGGSSSGSSGGGSSSGGSSSGGSSSGGSSSGSSGTCPGPTPASDPPWKSPRPVATACTAGDIAFIDQSAQQAGTTFATLQAGLTAQNAACAACVFSNETDAAWGPIVYAAGGGGGAFFNYGACFARAPGGSDACGKAIPQSEFCLDEVCSAEDCGSESATNACIQTSLQSAASCGKYDVNTACGAALQPLSQTCQSGIEVIRVMCGG